MLMAQELHARQAGRMDVGRISADPPAAISLPDLRLAQVLARLIANHERRVGEQDSVTVSGGGVRPADGLLDAACPVSVHDPAVPVDECHAGLVGHNVGSAFPPGKVNPRKRPSATRKLYRLLGAAGYSGERMRR